LKSFSIVVTCLFKEGFGTFWVSFFLAWVRFGVARASKVDILMVHRGGASKIIK
jgi:hypothetical protein